MSITGSMYTGASGLNSHSDAMTVISDNIANVNTVGFKTGRANFSDILGSVVAGAPAGSGSVVSKVQLNFTQGSLLGTGNSMDLAIRGDGFFMASGVVDGVRGEYYTRNGQMEFDENGYVVNGDGLRMQGYVLDGNGQLTNTVGDLKLEFNSIKPKTTENAEIVANLDAEQAIDVTPFDILDPSATSDYSTAMTVYDSLGTPHQLQIFFKKTQDVPNAQWDYHVAVPGDEVDPPVNQDLTQVGQGTLIFDTDGALNSYDLTNVNVQWAGAEAATINLDLGTGTANGGSGVDGITSYALVSTATFLTQDGYSSGDLAGMTVDETGLMSGVFTNGQQRVLGQLTLAKFASNDGLDRKGGGLFAATRESGAAVVGPGSNGGRGSIASGSLEGSNVDLAQEFVSMIQVQRGFQANSKTITTSDEMMNELVNLKR